MAASPIAGVNEDSLVAFANELLSAPPPSETAQRFSLPHLDLNLRSTSAGYAALCQRALIDDPYYSTTSRLQINVSVVDRQTDRAIPHKDWLAPDVSLVAFSRVIEAAGLMGNFDSEHAIWQFFSPHHGMGIQSLEHSGKYPPWEVGFPLRNFLHWAYQAQNMRLLHAGTLGLDGRGVLLAGAGGSGKSGTTLAGICNGLTSVGDDYICVAHKDDGPNAYPVMRLMKQDSAGLARVGLSPDHPGIGSLNWQNKHEFDFVSLASAAHAPSLELDAILIPRIAKFDRCHLSPASKREALYALLPNNFQQLPGGFRSGLSFVTDLVKTLPAYFLDLSPYPQEIADTVGTLISGARP